MIINRIGAEFEYEGTTYVIGAPIVGTPESEYEGLYGTITEIRVVSGTSCSDRNRKDCYS